MSRLPVRLWDEWRQATVTEGGTGSVEFEATRGVYTELQCGSYIFTDADYGRNRDRDGLPTRTFAPDTGFAA